MTTPLAQSPPLPCSASPGPWKSHLGAEDDPERWIVVADNGTRPYIIATVENGQPGDTLDTEKATADLIAAAPKMVAALQLLETWMGSEKGSGMWTAGYMLDEVIRPALREASGQNVPVVAPPTLDSGLPDDAPGG